MPCFKNFDESPEDVVRDSFLQSSKYFIDIQTKELYNIDIKNCESFQSYFKKIKQKEPDNIFKFYLYNKAFINNPLSITDKSCFVVLN
jgi:hypothetical protein